MHRIEVFLVLIITQLQLPRIKLYNAITKETTKIFHSHFCMMLCVSFKERKVFTETQAVESWLKI